MSLDGKHIYLFTYLANTIPQFFTILAIGTYFCSHVEYVLSACVQSPAAGIILLGWPFCVFSLVPLFVFIRCLLCFSRPSAACCHVTYCFSTFSSDEAMMDTSCNGLSLVFSDNCLHHSRFLCGSNCTAQTTVRQLVFYKSGSCWSIVF